VLCPFCNQKMQKGVMSFGGRDSVTWKSGEEKTGFIKMGKITAVKHTFLDYSIETYYCDSCKKMLFDTDVQF